MKRTVLILACLFSFAHAQKMKYVVAYCTLQQGMNGTKDTVFNGTAGNITAYVDLTAKTAVFDWKLPNLSTLKKYTIIESHVKKEEIYTTMGIYSIQLKCKNKEGKDCSIEIAISERINKIDLTVVDGNFVLNYNAIEVETK